MKAIYNKIIKNANMRLFNECSFDMQREHFQTIQCKLRKYANYLISEKYFFNVPMNVLTLCSMVM